MTAEQKQDDGVCAAAVSLYGVKVNGDDTVSVVSVPVIRETGKSYFIARRLPWETWSAFGFHHVLRYDKDSAFVSARAALEAYIQKRQADKARALSVAGQATKQIASANEQLHALAGPARTP